MTLRPRVTKAVLSPGVDLLMYFLDKKTSDFIKHKNTIPITPMGIKKIIITQKGNLEHEK